MRSPSLLGARASGRAARARRGRACSSTSSTISSAASHVDKVYANVIDRYKASQVAGRPCLDASLETHRRRDRHPAARAFRSSSSTRSAGSGTTWWSAGSGSARRMFSRSRSGTRAGTGCSATCSRASGTRRAASSARRCSSLRETCPRSATKSIASAVPRREPPDIAARLQPAGRLHGGRPSRRDRERVLPGGDRCLERRDPQPGREADGLGSDPGGQRRTATRIVKELDNGNFWEYNGHCKGDALFPMNRDHPLPAEGDSRAAFSHHYGGDGRVSERPRADGIQRQLRLRQAASSPRASASTPACRGSTSRRR